LNFHIDSGLLEFPKYPNPNSDIIYNGPLEEIEVFTMYKHIHTFFHVSKYFGNTIVQNHTVRETLAFSHFC
jgi:hypothetical protein